MRPRSSVLAGALPLVLLASSMVVLVGTAIKDPVFPSELGEPEQARIEQTLASLPLSFIENRGQLDPRVSYYVQGSTASVYFTPGGVTFSLTERASEDASSPELPAGWAGQALGGAARDRYTLKLDFVRADPDVTPVGTERAPALVSYFTGPQEDWVTGLPTYASVTYPDLWPGIDLVYEGTGSSLKYTFHVDPGADPSKISLAYRGATGLELTETGALEVSTPLTTLTEQAPFSYQQIAGKQVEVSSAYILDGAGATGTFEFDLGGYDPTRALVIDPVVLVYSGYIGGAGSENVSDRDGGVAVDGAGNAYVTGYTTSLEDSFPVKVGPDLTYNGGAYDAFIAKVDASGKRLVYAGYIGGADYDAGGGVAVDGAGNAYVTGYTTSLEDSFPVKVGPDLTHNGASDAFVAKVDVSGETLVYAGYVGGAGAESGHGVAVDGAGNAYVAGDTTSHEDSFPVKVGPDLTYNGGFSDIFVARVDVSGETLSYAGYIGGNSREFSYDVAVDGAGNAYVTGDTFSGQNSFPVRVGPDLTYNGDNDAFVAKVYASGLNLGYAGYVGGAGLDLGGDVAVDGAGAAYIIGKTTSDERSFPVRVGPDLTYNGGSYDVFVAKVDPSGQGLAYAGYIGGTNIDFGHGVAVDDAGNAYVTGYTLSNQDSFPVTRGPDLTINGITDAFVAKVDTSGETLAYAGYIGGAFYDAGSAIAVDGAGNAYVAGITASDEDSFPVEVGPDLTYNGGDFDAFVAKISSEGHPAPECTIIGTSGPDTIEGTGGDDLICARGGNDTVEPSGGDDMALGGAGQDALVGGRGSNVLRGGTGDDELRTADGIEGNDEAWGGPGSDICVIDAGDVTFGCEEVQVRPVAPRD